MADQSEPDSLPKHGGNLAFASERYGRPAGGWLDLSTGVNPSPYPAPAMSETDIARLPARDLLDRLLATARDAYRAPPDAGLIATPGSEIALRLLPFVAPPGPVAVVSPTYGSHAEAWRNAGRTVIPIASVGAVPDGAAVVVLANPNNPDGRVTEVGALLDVARRLAARNGLLIVDEAFADVAPEASLVPHLAGLPVLVTRSLGKFTGLAGLRLGFVAGAPAPVDRLAALIGDWPVSGPALTIGQAALADTAWREATRQRLRGRATRLRKLLVGSGLKATGGTDLFLLTEDGQARALHGRLAERGIWTRAFADQPTWLRFGLPGDEVAFARLGNALAEARALTPARSATTAPPPGARGFRRSRR